MYIVGNFGSVVVISWLVVVLEMRWLLLTVKFISNSLQLNLVDILPRLGGAVKVVVCLILGRLSLGGSINTFVLMLEKARLSAKLL